MSGDPVICPICGSRLTSTEKVFQCPKTHSFDVARQGHVNLLPGGGKKPKVLGDAREMLQARRSFLDEGHCRLLSDTLCGLVYDHLANNCDLSASTRVLDVGCGEGYFLGSLKGYLDSKLRDAEVDYFGMDISKHAAELAAQRHKAIRFIVADTKRKVLFFDGAIRVLLNIFAPRNPVEFDRVLSRDGILLVAIPGPDHLVDLRARLSLLAIQEKKEEHVVEEFSGLFVLSRRQAIEYSITVGGEDLIRLIKMTPNFWHTNSEALAALGGAERVITRMSFVILEFRKRL
jgi:23S rRNA (guanine745-N1)-methyltransferase